VDTNLRVILQQLDSEKSIDLNTLLEAIHSAIETAARKAFAHPANVVVEMDPNTLTCKVFELREVVDEVTDPTSQIS